MKIEREENPFRLGVWFPETQVQCILQPIDDPMGDLGMLLIAELTPQTGGKPPKLKFLLSMTEQEFMDGYCPVRWSVGDFVEDLEKAFQVFIKEKYQVHVSLSF